MDTPFQTKRALAAEAFRRIAAAIETAPEVYGDTTADEVLSSLLDAYDGPFTRRVPVPTATDGTLAWCPVCIDEAHSADCPVRVLEELWGIGLSGPAMLPANVGWTK